MHAACTRRARGVHAQVFGALVAFSRIGYDETVALLFALARLPSGPATATVGLADAVALLEGLVGARARSCVPVCAIDRALCGVLSACVRACGHVCGHVCACVCVVLCA